MILNRQLSLLGKAPSISETKYIHQCDQVLCCFMQCAQLTRQLAHSLISVGYLISIYCFKVTRKYDTGEYTIEISVCRKNSHNVVCVSLAENAFDCVAPLIVQSLLWIFFSQTLTALMSMLCCMRLVCLFVLFGFALHCFAFASFCFALILITSKRKTIVEWQRSINRTTKIYTRFPKNHRVKKLLKAIVVYFRFIEENLTLKQQSFNIFK